MLSSALPPAPAYPHRRHFWEMIVLRVNDQVSAQMIAAPIYFTFRIGRY
jgi:hypothetical protein